MNSFPPELKALRRRVRPLVIHLSEDPLGPRVTLPRISERQRRLEARAWRAKVRAGLA